MQTHSIKWNKQLSCSTKNFPIPKLHFRTFEQLRQFAEDKKVSIVTKIGGAGNSILIMFNHTFDFTALRIKFHQKHHRNN